MKNVNYFFTLVLVCFTFVLFGQADDSDDEHNVTISVPDIAIMDIEPNGSTGITMGLEALSDPAEAGEPLKGSTNSDLWINYTSVVPDATTRKITAVISSTPLPTGYDLKVVASAYSGVGDGSMGNPESDITLSDSPQDLIIGIGSAYTGNGASNGHQLTYTLEPDATGSTGSFENLDAGSGTMIVITYTIVDES